MPEERCQGAGPQSRTRRQLDPDEEGDGWKGSRCLIPRLCALGIDPLCVCLVPPLRSCQLSPGLGPESD